MAEGGGWVRSLAWLGCLGDPDDDGVYSVRLSSAAIESLLRFLRFPIDLVLRPLMPTKIRIRSPILLIPISFSTAWSHSIRLLPVTLLAALSVSYIDRIEIEQFETREMKCRGNKMAGRHWKAKRPMGFYSLFEVMPFYDPHRLAHSTEYEPLNACSYWEQLIVRNQSPTFFSSQDLRVG